jgi:Zn finger protein HypA/HybF involved in hydrogenase expression
MATSLQRRVEALEQADGGNGCPRCSGTVVVFVNGKLDRVSKDGRRFTPEEAEAFAGEEEDGRCPVCGQGRQEIKAGREPPSR